MNEPPSPTLTTGVGGVVVVGADEQVDVPVDVERWSRLAQAVLEAEGRSGELTLTFVDPDEMAELNQEHLGHSGPTDVLSFPMDDRADVHAADVPVLLGDVVVCPVVAVAQASTHAGTPDDEFALLVVHGVLHVLGLDHAEAADALAMGERERELLSRFHWNGPVPTGFRQDHEGGSNPSAESGTRR